MPWYPTSVASGIREIAESAPGLQCEKFDAAIGAAYKIIERLDLEGCDTFINLRICDIEDAVNDARDGIVALREKFVDLMHYADKEEDRANENENACSEYITKVEALEEENNELTAKIEKLEEQLAELNNN